MLFIYILFCCIDLDDQHIYHEVSTHVLKRLIADGFEQEVISGYKNACTQTVPTHEAMERIQAEQRWAEQNVKEQA
jgi:hypothetical protein